MAKKDIRGDLGGKRIQLCFMIFNLLFLMNVVSSWSVKVNFAHVKAHASNLLFVGILCVAWTLAGTEALEKARTIWKRCPSGSLGCSDGYNYNLYRPLSPIHINTEGREQMHTVLEKCANTLRFMSYENFMIWMSVFFFCP